MSRQDARDPRSTPDARRAGLAWQLGIWDRMPGLYARDIDRLFDPVIERVVGRAALRPGQRVLDLGAGTGSVAIRAATVVAPAGNVLGVDISREMLEVARRRAAAAGLGHCSFREGGAEAIPADAHSFDVVLASLSVMYVIDRPAAVREIARVLRPGGRFVAAVWAGPDQCDLVLFQQTAGRFAPAPPVPGVGPGAVADPAPFLAQLRDAGIDASVETEVLGFDVPHFAAAWDAFARVTTSELSPQRQHEARAATLAAMWSRGDGPRHFRNGTHFIVGRKQD